MVTNTSSPPGGGDKIPLRLLVLATVALLCGVVAGGLTLLSTGQTSAAILAGLATTAAAFGWLAEHVA